MSGCLSNSRHSATRRLSPPERILTGVSPRRASQRVHRHLEPAVEVPRIRRVELLLNFALLFEQRGHLVVGHRLGELLVDLLELLEQLDCFVHAFFDDLANGFGFIELRLLFEKADV